LTTRAFVLDGLLYNESELEIEEHYTDTHGYTEINFAAFAMLGLRFCPRIRGVQHQRIYRIDPNYDHGSLTSLVNRAHLQDRVHPPVPLGAGIAPPDPARLTECPGEQPRNRRLRF
jgi:TnpA family transposase